MMRNRNTHKGNVIVKRYATVKTLANIFKKPQPHIQTNVPLIVLDNNNRSNVYIVFIKRTKLQRLCELIECEANYFA